MDDLLREFLTETSEHLDTVDVELVRFEQEPNNEAILRNIFRLVHTIKGTCGFLGLPRLEALAHAAETLMGKFRDGATVTKEAVSLILVTLDRIKGILSELERHACEPEGGDADLIESLARMAASKAAPNPSGGLGRPLGPGEVSLDVLERAFREAPGPDVEEAPANLPQPEPGGIAAGETSDASPAKAQTIRVNIDTIEHLMTMVSELVLTRNQLLEIARRLDDSGYKVPLQRLSHITAELQDGVMKTRMQPIGNAWQKLPRVVRDLSSELAKKIELVTVGADTELDRQVLELIKDPLTHMVRNSADHGIEPPLERKAAGKNECGTIRLSAYQEGGSITIEVADDGRGLDYAEIRRKAVERGLAGAAEIERMSDARVAKFIFHPGFSTAKTISSVSGRGVGMDVVLTNIEMIGGTVDIRSEKGRGTRFTIKIPLTLAIVAALIVSAESQRFAIPQLAVRELVRVGSQSEAAIERINGTPVLRLRDKLLPIISLSAALALDGAGERNDGFVVVTQVGRQTFGILVDGVFHTEEIVVKPMASKLRHLSHFSGNTILGDGAVVLIIDPNGLARVVGSGAGETQIANDDSPAVQSRDESRATTLLVFRGGGEGLKAVPLSLVTRLEKVDARTIEWLGDRPLMQYRGQLMPLVAASADLAVKREGSQALVVFSDGERAMGLAVDEIVDIVDDELKVDLAAGRPDLIGSAIIRGRATEVVNVAHYLPLAHGDWARPARSACKRSVLLVDDSSFFREMLTPILKASGYHVAAASSADEALRVVGGGAHIDVLVTDVEMPDKDGFALVEALRTEPRFSGLPVIALSSGLNTTAMERGRTLGIARFVAKFDRSGLLSAIAETEAAIGVAA